MKLIKVQDLLPRKLCFDRVVDEILQHDIPWTRHYSEYQSGGWWTCSLVGRSADATNGKVSESGIATVTDALERLPFTGKLLREMQLDYMMVRLARLDPGGALWEHKDYQNLRQVPRQRIHLPLVTNPDAFLVAGGGRFHMAQGAPWMFRPTKSHAVCNHGTEPRIHVIIDAYQNERLSRLVATPRTSEPTPMPELSPRQIAEKASMLRKTAQPGATNLNFSDCLESWEEEVLRLYFSFAVPEGELYRALEQVYRNEGNAARADFWAKRRRMVLGEGLHA